MRAKRFIAAILILALTISMVGCGSSKQDAKDPVYVVSLMLYGTSVNETASSDLIAELNSQFPEIAAKGDGIGSYIYEDGTDASAVEANMSKMGLLMNANKVGLVISNHTGMGSFCANDAFKPVGEIFTQEELDSISYPTVTYQKKNVKGEPVGDPVVYGWDISGSETLKALLGDETVEIGLIAKYPQQTYAKKVLLHLLTQVE